MANTKEELIPKKDAISEVRQACYHFSDLYYHFSKILIEELGYEKGKELIVKAVRSRAEDRAGKIVEKAEKLQVPRKAENYVKVTEIPFLGWDKSLGNLECPYAAAWLDRFDRDPWFREIASLYCTTNDPLICELFTGDTSQEITKNVLWGDDTCDRVYFPISEGAARNKE
jgi:hypothetical protein